MKTFAVGDRVSFLCSGRRRGGHVRVTGVITKVNPKTVDLVEAAGSYKPGTLWNVHKQDLILTVAG